MDLMVRLQKWRIKILKLHFITFSVSDAIVIVLENQKNEIQQKIDRSPNKLKLEYYTISSDQDYGTADSLRLISEK